MAKYILRRILLMVPVILGVSIIIFTIMSFASGDPTVLMLGENASEEDIAELREELGLDDPLPVQYFNYIKDALQGDLGRSYQNNQPVAQEIALRFPNTLRLTIVGTILSIIIGVPIGIISAVKQYSWMDNCSTLIALVFTAMPSFWLGLMLMLFFSLRLGWFPATGSDTWLHFVLPSITLAAASMAMLIRMTRSTMLEVIRQDYIRTAKAKGAPEFRVIMGHAIQNAMLPVVTSIGLNFGRQLGGAIVIETVFNIQGIGLIMINGISSRDRPMVMAAVMLAAIMASLVNLLVDVLYTFIDPRIKSEFAK